ncbi:hypothetical protein JCM11251_002013 [Rhodosporidiobolus azoricus]
MSFSFGAAAKPAAPTFSFGQPAAPATSTPSLFGSAPAPAAGSAPSLFGGAPAATSQPSSTPSLFGGAPAGSAAPATGGLFGSTAAGAAGSGTTSLFGAPKPAGSTGGLFGSTATSQPGATPSLFGTAQPAAGGTGTSLFGGGAAQPATGGGLFGSTQPAAGATTSLFGQPAQPAVGTGGTSLFGAQQPAAAAPQPAVTAAPLFGQSQSAATASLFGSKPASAAAPASTSLFGPGAASTFGASTLNASTSVVPSPAPLPPLGSPLPPSPNEPTIESRLESLKAAWDPTNPKCKFQTWFYNEIPVGQSASMFGKPPLATDAGWEKARRENPDPERLVPALAIGFSALQKRIEAQSLRAQQQITVLTQIHDHLTTLSSTHSLTTSLRTLRAQQNAVALGARLTALVAKVSAVSPGRNSSVRREEDELRVELEGLQGQVETVKARGTALWSGVGALKARKREEDCVWSVADEASLAQVLEILSEQQRGLDHLTRTLLSMTQDVDVVGAAFGRPAVGQKA